MMQFNTNDMDNKLRQLETQSIADMSMMDEHWQQMKTTLHPEFVSARPGSFLLKNWGRWIIAGFLIMGLFFLAYKLIKPDTSKKASDKTVSGVVSPVKPLSDTTPPSAIKNNKTTITHKFLTQSGNSRIKYSSDLRDSTVPMILISDPPRIPVFENKLILEDFFRDLEKPSQVFMINNKRDTLIRGSSGTSLLIPANSFSEKGPVIIHLREFYNYQDMINNRLSTTCNGNLLITGGMLNIEAFSENEKIIKSRNAITIEMPAKIFDDSMQLFLPSQIVSPSQNISQSLSSSVDTMTATPPTPGFINWLPAGGNQYQPTENRKIRINSEISTTIIAHAKLADKIEYENSTDIAMLKDKYNFRIIDLGWINCDRLYNDNRPRITFSVVLPDTISNFQAFLVFDKMKSIMQGYRNNDKIIFRNLPEGETAKLIVVGVQNNKPVMTFESVQISGSPFLNFRFEEVTPSEFKEKAATLDQ